MNNKYLEAYTLGIFSLAKEQSENLKKSDITIDLYQKDTYQDKLNKLHRIENPQIEELNETLEQALNDWFIDQSAVKGATTLLQETFGNSKKIYTITKGIDDIFKKNKPYYTIEDLLIIEFKEYIIWIILGNNE